MILFNSRSLYVVEAWMFFNLILKIDKLVYHSVKISITEFLTVKMLWACSKPIEVIANITAHTEYHKLWHPGEEKPNIVKKIAIK